VSGLRLCTMPRFAAEVGEVFGEASPNPRK
jgi:hypothetical protein